MYKHILVPTDGSKLSLKAAKAAAGLAKATKAKVTAVYVMEPFMPPMTSEGMVFHVGYSIKDYEKGTREVASKALAKITAAAAAAKVPCDSIAVFNENPWEGIIKAAGSKGCDVIVMASHGRRGLAGLLLGSETQKVLTHSKVPVLVCR